MWRAAGGAEGQRAAAKLGHNPAVAHSHVAVFVIDAVDTKTRASLVIPWQEAACKHMGLAGAQRAPIKPPGC
jgi:hypothetical protein